MSCRGTLLGHSGILRVRSLGWKNYLALDLETWPHITSGALHQRGSDGGPRSVILSPSDPRHTLKTMLLQVPPENGLGASFLLMEGGWSSVVGKAQRPKQAVFLGDTHARGKSLSLSLGAFSLSLNSSVNLDTFRMKKFITG